VALNTRVSLLAVVAGLGGAWRSRLHAVAIRRGQGPLPSCGAHGTQLTLAVGAYTSIDPASDSGCVTFAANTSRRHGRVPGATMVGRRARLPLRHSGSSPRRPWRRSRCPALRGRRPRVSRRRDAGGFRSFPAGGSRANHRYARTDRSAPVVGSAVPPPSAAAGPPTVGSLRTFQGVRRHELLDTE